MENKSIINSFCGCKPYKAFSIIKILQVLIKKRRDTAWTSSYIWDRYSRIDQVKFVEDSLKRKFKRIWSTHPFTFFKGPLPQILLGPSLNTLFHIIWKGKKLNNLWRKWFYQYYVNLKARFAREKKNTKISEMSLSSVPRRNGSDFCATDNSQALSPVFLLWYLSKKELARMMIHVRKIFNCKVPFKCCCQCTL